MKSKTTKKELQENYNYIIRAGYCELSTLLRTSKVREFGYSCGIYGWNWDAYEVEASNGQPVVVCTGYRDMTGKRTEGLKKFEEKARKIYDYNNKKTYEQKEKEHAKLLKKFADYCIEQIKKEV